MTKWEKDKKWSDRFIPEIKTILAQHLVSEAPPEEDMERNTDLIVLTMKPYRIGCRIRRSAYLEYYGDEFTIRAGRPSGNKTELQKIIEGWGDYLFYGFSDEEEKKIASYFLGDLNIFRLWFNQTLCRLPEKKHPGIAQSNTDGSSWFIAFKKDKMPDDFFVTRYPCE